MNSTRAGGRVTNGPVWVEWVANATKATLMDYAVWTAGYVINSLVLNECALDIWSGSQPYPLAEQVHPIRLNGAM